MFWMRNKDDNFPIHTLIWGPGRHALVPSSIPCEYLQCMQARREMCVILYYQLKHPKPPPILLKRCSRVQTSTYPCPTPRPHLQDPTTFSLAFSRRWATDVSIRPRPPVQIYLKCISFICMEICVST